MPTWIWLMLVIVVLIVVAQYINENLIKMMFYVLALVAAIYMVLKLTGTL